MSFFHFKKIKIKIEKKEIFLRYILFSIYKHYSYLFINGNQAIPNYRIRAQNGGCIYKKSTNERWREREREEMDEVKKRKLDEGAWNGQVDSDISPLASQELRSLLDPLPKPQLVDLLARLYAPFSSNPCLVSISC